jgi:hypothetical protein
LSSQHNQPFIFIHSVAGGVGQRRSKAKIFSTFCGGRTNAPLRRGHARGSRSAGMLPALRANSEPSQRKAKLTSERGWKKQSR